MKKRKLKKGVFYTLYAIGIFAIFMVLSFIDFKNLKVEKPLDAENNIDYVNDLIIDDSTNVVTDELIINRPYLKSNVNIAYGFYDYDASLEEQKNAILFYENTYMPSTGVFYSSDEKFEATAILPGEVTSVSEDPILGNIVLVTHENELVSSYSSLSEVNVLKGDKVIQGQVIGISGTSKFNTDSQNNLYFELLLNSVNVDPEKYYNHALNEVIN